MLYAWIVAPFLCPILRPLLSFLIFLSDQIAFLINTPRALSTHKKAFSSLADRTGDWLE